MSDLKMIASRPFFADYASRKAAIDANKIQSLLQDYNKAFYQKNIADYQSRGLTFNAKIIEGGAFDALTSDLGPAWAALAASMSSSGKISTEALAAGLVKQLDTGNPNGKIDLSEVLAWNAAQKDAFFETSLQDKAFNLVASPKGYITQSSLENFFKTYAGQDGVFSVDKIKALAADDTDEGRKAVFKALADTLKPKDSASGASVARLAGRFMTKNDAQGPDDADQIVDYHEIDGVFDTSTQR